MQQRSFLRKGGEVEGSPPAGFRIGSEKDGTMFSSNRSLLPQKAALIAVSYLLFSLLLNVGSDCLAHTIVSSQQISEAIREFVLRSACWPEDSLQVSCRYHSEVELEGTGQVKLVVLPATSRQLRGLVPVKVQIWLGQQLKRQLLVTAEVRLFHTVVVARRRVKRAKLLTPQILKLERKEVTDLEGGYFTQIEQLQGRRAKFSIPPGVVLTPEKVEAVPVVKRESKVKILVQLGNVVAWTEGIALQEGGPGQIIRVRNLRSRKRLMAQVLDSHTVRVIF